MERLDKILVIKGFAQSRKRAADLVISNKVIVNEKIINDPKKTFKIDSNISLIENDIPWVSRAALKLEKALDFYKVNPNDRYCLDVGSSTGGFTQVLLDRGAKHVYSLDVGTNQMHQKLLGDRRITLMEGTHILDVDNSSFNQKIDLIVIDVSFISLTKILEKINNLLVEGGDVIALIKPQFEVGKENINKGVVKDKKQHKNVCLKISDFSKQIGFKVDNIIDSPILGGDGNIEFLIHLKK